MLKLYIPSTDVSSLEKGIEELKKNQDIKGLMLLTCHSNDYDKNGINRLLTNTNLPATGAICLELIYEGEIKSEGAIVIGFTQNCKEITINDLNVDDIDSSLAQHQIESYGEDSTVFVFVDALAPNKDYLIESLYNTFGLDSNYIGGASASLSFMPFPCVYNSSGMIQGGASILVVDIPSSVGVSHGWEAISPTLKVTEANDNEIISLDWKPAFEVYKSIIEKHSGIEFDTKQFFDHSKSYPFGITKLDSEMIVRDPFKQENEVSVFTLDKIEEGSHICVLFGNMSSLLDGAKEASNRAQNNNFDKSQRIIIDCISRVLYMGDEYDKELKILDPDKSAFGACTFGEIANSGDSFLEIYNKTAVVGQLKKS